MPKKRMTFSLEPSIGKEKLQRVATHLGRSKSNTLEVLIDEAEYKIRVKTRKGNDDESNN